jgi:D-arabinose 5-phosphate isomerase GutQ
VGSSRDATGSLDAARALVRAEAAALAGLVDQVDGRLLRAAQMILGRAGKVIPVGVGTSGETARRMAHLLAVTGTPSFFLHPTDGLHGGLGAIGAGDVVIAISKGGQSSEVNEFAHRARLRGADLIVLTCDPDSVLAAEANLLVALESPDAAEPGSLISMGSTLVFAAWGDALAVVLMQARGYGWDEVLFTHPGGAVGQVAAQQASDAQGSWPEARSR